MVISIDLREPFVDIKIKKTTKVLLSIEFGEVMQNHTFKGLEDMLASVNDIYNEARESRRGFSKNHIEKILILYANFILINFSNITEAMQ